MPTNTPSKAPTTAVKPTAIATIDAAMIVVTTKGSSPKSIGITSGQKVAIEAQIDTQEAIKLIVKGNLVAQKPEKKTLTGTKITISDRLTVLELLPLQNGGTLEYETDGKTIKAYHAPKVGEEVKHEKCDITLFSAVMEGSTVTKYMAVTFPSCEGEPVALGAEDDVFNAPDYTLTSTPGKGESAYDIEFVDKLPTLTDPA